MYSLILCLHMMSVLNAISNQRYHTSVSWKSALINSQVYNCKSDTDTLGLKNDILISTTYFTSKPWTFSVMYGCPPEMKKFVTRLEKFKEQAFHPLVMPMIFAEHERGRFMTAMELKGAKLEGRIMDLENRLRADEHKKPRDSEAVKKDNQEMTMKDCDSTKLWDDVSQLKNGTASFIKVLAALEHQLETKTFEKLELRPNVQGKTEAIAQSMSSEYIRCRIKELDAEADGNIRKCDSLLAGMALAIQVVSHITVPSTPIDRWVADHTPGMELPYQTRCQSEHIHCSRLAPRQCSNEVDIFSGDDLPSRHFPRRTLLLVPRFAFHIFLTHHN